MKHLLTSDLYGRSTDRRTYHMEPLPALLTNVEKVHSAKDSLVKAYQKRERKNAKRLRDMGVSV